MEHLSNLRYEDLLEAVENIYDVVEIWDGDYRLLYVNRACYHLYGARPEEIIGRKLDELMGRERFWTPSTLPYIYKNKKSILQMQKTYMGIDIETIGVPILDESGEIKFVVMSARESYDMLSARFSAVERDIESDAPGESQIVYKSLKLKNVLKQAKKIARSDVNCLILGETGTGKNVFARYIYENSGCSHRKMITLNMASMSPSIIESELFGYRKGAFTGADKAGKKGLVEAADGGTLFLDEIGELPMTVQAKLLQVLQDGEFIPLGATDSVRVDVRIIAATNRDLAEMVRLGTFREDLYHCVSVIELSIPPVRERGRDVELILIHFLNEFNRKYQRNCVFSPQAMEKLTTYKWPGNVRELSNVVERCVVMAEEDEIDVKQLPLHIFKLDYSPDSGEGENLEDVKDRAAAVEEYEGRIVRASYRKNPSSRKLAKALNISQTSARRMIEKHVR